MEYRVYGFKQEAAINFDLDIKDLKLLRYFIDYKDAGIVKKETIDNVIYYWVKYDVIVNNLPILKLSKRSIMNRFHILAEKGILKRYTKKQNGTYSFFAVGENYKYL